MSHFRYEGCYPNNYDHPNHKKYYCTWTVKLTNSFLINRSNSYRVTNHWKLSHIQVPSAQSFVSDSSALVLKPSENYIKIQWYYRRGNQHCVPENNVLRVMAGSVSHSGPRKRFLLFMWHSHVISVKRSTEQNWNVHVHQWVDSETTQHLSLFYTDLINGSIFH